MDTNTAVEVLKEMVKHAKILLRGEWMIDEEEIASMKLAIKVMGGLNKDKIGWIIFKHFSKYGTEGAKTIWTGKHYQMPLKNLCAKIATSIVSGLTGKE